MDKLLELIKEYWVETFDDNKPSKIEYEEKSGTFYWKYQPLPGMGLQQGQILHRTTVLSKDFGFVEWLVENEKIEENKIEIHWFSFYESVLMQLAIQDNPIEFLVSILK